MKIIDIKIGERHRKDLGNLHSLMESIRELGLLHPVVITPENELIAGVRRIEACKLLGWSEIPVTVISLDDIVKGEFAENVIRKDFLPSEIDAIRRALEPAEKEAARERILAGKAPSGNFPEGQKGEVRDKIGAFAGVSGRTVEKIAAVVEAAEKDPGRFRGLVDEMDRTENVDAAYRKLKQVQDESRVLSLVPTEGKYRTLIIDPPWDHEGFSLAGRGRPKYAVMSHDELLSLPVAEWAEDDCHLYLWTTNNFLLRAGELIHTWGFDYKTILTWVKPRIGLGSYFRSSTEHILFAVRGHLNTRVNDIPTHFEAIIGEHSEKPDTFYKLVKRASYPPYGEVFQITARNEFIGLFQ